MNIINLIIITISILVLIYFLIENGFKIRKNNLKIPGPIGLPIIGNLHQLIDFHNTLFKWYEKYGPIYKIKLGSIETVVLTGYPIMKRAIKDYPTIFSNRYEFSSKFKMNNNSNLLMCNGDQYKLLRRLIHSELTSTKVKIIEKSILIQVENLCEIFDQFSRDESIVSIFDYFNLFSLNIILCLLFGNEFEICKEKIQIVSNQIKSIFESSETPVLSDFIPLLRPFENYKNDKFAINYKKLSNTIEQFIIVYKNKIENGLIDKNENQSIVWKLLDQFNNGSLNWDNLVGSCCDLCIGGTDTSSDTLSFSFILLTNNQSCQEKLYNEIQKSLIINNNNEESIINDNNNNKDLIILKHSKYSSSIPYLSMIMKEVYRLYPVGALGLPNVAEKDLEIDGFKIKKGTQIIKNFYQSHRHEDFFKLPNHFIPERFIESGNKFIYGCGDTNMVQFGLGNRDCIGKSLATCEIFTTIATLINRYEFLNPTPLIPLNDKCKLSLSLHPQPNVKFLIKKRKINNNNKIY
ncbi:hypothetical protein ACTFIY_007852 [Dictyostelium cf. discoideum]